MKKILFLIHDLGQGGAEKVLVNLVNHMDNLKFDITVMTLFDCGENRQFLSPKIKYKTWCKKMIPGNSHLMKLLSPERLHNIIVKEKYDIEVAYLEGPCARIISGCTDSSVKLISWIHIEQRTTKKAAISFRSIREARECYEKFHKIICVSQTVKEDFINVLNINGADTIKKYKKASCLISLAPLSQPGKNGAIMILIIVVINPIIKEINKAC